ncbi:MAG: glycosyltransferase [Alcaligenaceae bacterium]|nr:glycosyltransferase [Alcaligenaceae bacterium]
MRILLVVTGLQLGGAERQVVDLADRLAARGHQVAIAYMVGEATQRPADPAISVYPLLCRKSALGMLGGALRLVRLVWRWRPDVVHSHMVHANLFARLLRPFAPMRRLVCTAHNTVEGGRGVTVAYRLTDFLASVSTNVSREAVEVFERIGAVRKGRMLAVLNGIDTQRFSDHAELRIEARRRLFPKLRGRLIVSVGRLAEQKNHAGLLRVFAGVLQTLPETELWIAGDGPLREALTRQVADLGLQDHVSLLGARQDVPDLMRAADVFALSSRFEGFGLVVAEAMASGTPVVATDAGGVAEVMNGIGYLVPVGDEAALCDGLIQALSMTPEQHAEIARAARRHVETHLDIERTVDTWLRIYDGDYRC